MIRLGIVDLDSSHGVEFTKRLNHIDIDQDQWVDGAKVVMACPGESKLSPERIPTHTEAMKKYGVPLVADPREMIGKIDAVMIESVDGSVHLERSLPFIEAGVPLFVDKPFACSSRDAREMVKAAQMHHLPIFSSSSLRYAPEVAALSEPPKKTGKLVGADTFGPATLHPRNPGLFHYGIHPVEMLFALMGPGCDTLARVGDDKGEVVTGYWKDGRVGSVRGIRSGRSGYGFTAFGEKTIQQQSVSTQFIYRELLVRVVKMFQTREAPIPPDHTLEIVAFIEAALDSGRHDGKPTKVVV